MTKAQRRPAAAEFFRVVPILGRGEVRPFSEGRAPRVPVLCISRPIMKRPPRWQWYPSSFWRKGGEKWDSRSSSFRLRNVAPGSHQGNSFGLEFFFHSQVHLLQAGEVSLVISAIPPMDDLDIYVRTGKLVETDPSFAGHAMATIYLFEHGNSTANLSCRKVVGKHQIDYRLDARPLGNISNGRIADGFVGNGYQMAFGTAQPSAA